MSREIEIKVGVDTTPVERCVADVAAVGFFVEDRPLRGSAGRADWRLCGLVSRALAAERLPERAGSAVLLPGRGRLRAPHVLLLALGSRKVFRPETAARVIRLAVERALDLDARILAMAPLGFSLVRHPSHADLLLAEVCQVAAGRARPLELRVLSPAEQADRAQRALEDAAGRFSSPGVRLRVSGSDGSQPGIPRGAALPRAAGATRSVASG